MSGSKQEEKKKVVACAVITLCKNLCYERSSWENFVAGSSDLKSRWQIVRGTRPLCAMLLSEWMMKYLGTNTGK